jgi:hypothetical protein
VYSELNSITLSGGVIELDRVRVIVKMKNRENAKEL